MAGFFNTDCSECGQTWGTNPHCWKCVRLITDAGVTDFLTDVIRLSELAERSAALARVATGCGMSVPKHAEAQLPIAVVLRDLANSLLLHLDKMQLVATPESSSEEDKS